MFSAIKWIQFELERIGIFNQKGREWGVCDGHVGSFTIWFSLWMQHMLMSTIYRRETNLLRCPYSLLVWASALPASHVMQALSSVYIQQLYSIWLMPWPIQIITSLFIVDVSKGHVHPRWWRSLSETQWACELSRAGLATVIMEGGSPGNSEGVHLPFCTSYIKRTGILSGK